MNRLTDDEVLALKKVLVKDNKKIKKITEEIGTMGAGNTNTSKYSSDNEFVLMLDYLDGRDICLHNPFERFGCSCDEKVAIAAVADDVLYLIIKNRYYDELKVEMVELGNRYGVRTEVAYDTFGIYRLTPEE